MIRTSIQIGNTRLTDNDFTSLYLDQEIGQHNSFEIRLRQDAIAGVLLEKTNSWIGEPITIGIESVDDELIMLGLVKDFFKGIVSSLSVSRNQGTAELIVRGFGPSIVLDDGAQTRSFTDKGLQEIADEVFGPYGDFFSEAPIIDPQQFSSSIPYCVQYRESNFKFLDRLSDRYGEWFYYDGLQFYFGKSDEPDSIKLNFGEQGLTHFDMSLNALPNSFEIKGYDYEKHEFLTEENPDKTKLSDIGEAVKKAAKEKIFNVAKSNLAIQVAQDKEELKNIALRKEQITLDEAVLVRGGSSNSSLKLGAVIELEDKLINDSYGEFVITKISHHIDQGGDYNNSFEAIPNEIKTAPLSAIPSPPFCEMQLAKVVDVNDEKSLGRIKVEFLWQEESGETSPWIRVASPYTGKDKGFYIIPEVDDHVLVAFENNHADKPYVLSGMYNGDAKPEWFDSKNRNKGFKSKGKNEWKFDDKSGSISISAPDTLTLKAGKKVIIETGLSADSMIILDAGEGGIYLIGGKQINTSTESLELNSDNTISSLGKKYDVDIQNAITVKGANINLEGGTTTSVKGGTSVSVEGGGGKIDASGGMVKLNS